MVRMDTPIGRPPWWTGDRGVAVSARSLTDVRVRSLACSTAPCARLAQPGGRSRDGSQAGFEQADVLRGRRMSVAARVLQRRASAERVEIGRKPPDHVQDDLLDPLGILREHLE